jgi:hypothetical protein
MPNARMQVDHTKADATLAVRHGTNGIAQNPGASGTADLNSPKKRSRNMPAAPHFPLRAIDRDECHYDGAILFQADAIAEGVRGWPR